MMMLHHLNEQHAAGRIEQALLECYAERTALTRDVGGTAGTQEFTSNLIAHMRAPY